MADGENPRDVARKDHTRQVLRVLIDGPHDGETVELKWIGPWLHAPLGAQGEVVYRIDFSDQSALVAHFQGFWRRDAS